MNVLYGSKQCLKDGDLLMKNLHYILFQKEILVCFCFAVEYFAFEVCLHGTVFNPKPLCLSHRGNPFPNWPAVLWGVWLEDHHHLDRFSWCSPVPCISRTGRCWWTGRATDNATYLAQYIRRDHDTRAWNPLPLLYFRHQGRWREWAAGWRACH